MALYKTLVKKVSISPEKKTKQKDYLAKGQLPIIDQGQQLIGGYADNLELQLSCNLPVIVFGDHTRAVKYVDFPFGAGADGIKVLEPAKGIYPKFLYYATQYLVLRLEDRGYARHYQYIEKKELDIPSISEQKRIVAYIEELFSELDNGEETLRKTKQQLAVYRQAVLKDVFQGVAQNSAMVSMGELLVGIEGGKSFKCEERPPQETEFGIVKVSAVTWGAYNEEESKTCQPSQFIESKRINVGDFLFSRANTLELVGNCVVVETVNKNLMLSDKILRFHFKNGILPKYVMYYLRTHEGKKQIQSFSTGNQESMRNIGQDRIKKITVPVCSTEDQNRVISEIETRLSVCDSIEKTVHTALQQAEAMRQSILIHAFERRL